MKKTYSMGLAMATAAMLMSSVSVKASDQDSKIEDSIKQSYTFKTYLKDDSIHVKSKDGVVTLTGSVADEAQRGLAADTASGQPGVVSVDNELKIKGGTQVAEKSDSWISVKVKSALLFHRNVSANNTTVNVQNGVVTLTGTAKSAAEKDLTTQYARDVEGVQSVNNQMSIVGVTGGAPVIESAGAQNGLNSAGNSVARTGETAGQKIDDGSITAQVKGALLAHRSTSAVNTKVKTVNGNVTITGVAKNSAEKDLVTQMARDVNGVANVDNEMTVESQQ